MYERERELKGIFARIAFVLLLLILFFNIYSIVCSGRDGLLALFPDMIIVDCAVEIFCAFLYFLAFLLPSLIFHLISPRKTARPIDFSGNLPRPHSFFKTVAIVFLSIGAIIAASYFNAWLVPSFESGGVAIRETVKPYQLVLEMFASAVIPAFAEELLFRGVILSNLRPYGKGMAVLVSAILFGVMHMNFAQILYATAAGVILGLVYVKTRSLWLCILIHFANNLFSIVEGYMYNIFDASKAELICLLAELVIFAVGILSALIFFVSVQNEPQEETHIGVFGETEAIEVEEQVAWGRVTKQFFCPAMIIYLIVALLNTVVW